MPPPADPQGLSPLGAALRRADPDRFFCCLFAPPAAREALFTIYGFNHELARAREAAREPGLALIRLQWWREVVEGAQRRHEVATPLTALLAGGRVAPGLLLRMIDAREAECAPQIEDMTAWIAYLRGRGGALAQAAGQMLGAGGAALARLEDLGAAYAAAGVLRGVAGLARQGRCLLPADRLGDAGLSPDHVVSGAAVPPALLQGLAQPAQAWLAGAVALGNARSAGLPGVLARRDLHPARLCRPPAPRGLGDRLAVMRAAWSGRI